MAEILTTLALFMVGLLLFLNIIRWLKTAPSELLRLLKQGSSSKLTFVFLGTGILALVFVALEISELTIQNNPLFYLSSVVGVIILTASLYHIYLSTNYQSVGYFFLVILKLLLIIIPAIGIFLISKSIAWAFLYAFVTFLFSYYSIYKIKTSPKNGGGRMTDRTPISITLWNILKYTLNSLLQAGLGYYVSKLLSNL